MSLTRLCVPFIALAIYKCVFDMIFVQQYLWLPFVSATYFYNDDLTTAPYNCIASETAAFFAFLSQFSFLGSELCFLVISIDLRKAYSNPFSSFNQSRWYFASFVLGFSLLTALALMSMGNKVYGLASEGVVWIQDRRSDYSVNYPKSILFYFLVCAIYAYCMWANFQYYRNEKGFSNTVNNRISIMRRARRFTLAYITYDTIVLLLEFISYLNNGESRFLSSLPAYFYCCRGICALAIILYCNATELKWETLNPLNFSVLEAQKNDAALEGLLFQPHLNVTLRMEILYFTTHGIIHAARENMRLKRNSYDTGIAAIYNKENDVCFSFDEKLALR